jgi:hypothetical protein
MFRYKKYGLRAGAVIENLKTPEASKPLDPRCSGVGIRTQVFEPLSKSIDLNCGSVLGGLFAILGEFGASKRRVALPGEFGDLARRSAGIDRWRGRRRGLQEPIHPLGACPDSEARPQLLAHRDATWGAVRQSQFFDNRDDGLV